MYLLYYWLHGSLKRTSVEHWGFIDCVMNIYRHTSSKSNIQGLVYQRVSTPTQSMVKLFASCHVTNNFRDNMWIILSHYIRIKQRMDHKSQVGQGGWITPWSKSQCIAHQTCQSWVEISCYYTTHIKISTYYFNWCCNCTTLHPVSSRLNPRRRLRFIMWILILVIKHTHIEKFPCH